MSDFIRTIIQSIHDANATRNESNIGRRIIKLGEEFGEVAEAYLNITSKSNGKGMTWDDVREELADTLIVAVDVALTYFDTEELIDTIFDGFVPTTHELERDILLLQLGIGRLATNAPEYNSYSVRWDARHLVALSLTICQKAMPDQLNSTQESRDAALLAEIERKLAKWKRNRDTGKAATDAE